MTDAQMEGDMEEQVEDMEGQDPEEGVMDNEDEDAEDGDQKNEYQKKEFVARPWVSDSLEQTIKEVEAFTIKNTR